MDLRIEKTRCAIRNAFLQLLLQHCRINIYTLRQAYRLYRDRELTKQGTGRPIPNYRIRIIP